MANELRESAYSGSLKSPEEMLSLWRQVEVDIATVGQSYLAPGGVSVTLADIGKVRQSVAYWEARVLARRGVTPGRNYADVAPHTSGSDNLGSLS